MKLSRYVILLIQRFFRGRSRISIIFTSVIMVTSIGVIDYITGLDISLSLLYLLPIMLVAWMTERKATIYLSIFSIIISVSSDIAAGKNYSNFNLIIEFWNSISKFFFYLIIAYAFIALKEAFNKEKTLARTDSLTGIANQRYFFEFARIEVYKARRYKHFISLAYIDADNFKHVNDAFGHTEGNKLVILIATAIKNNIRTSDLVARMGGDEFAILLPETDSKQARIVIEKLQKNLLAEVRRDKWPITFSTGVVTYFSPKTTIIEIIKMADRLMYSVKNSGKNKIKYKDYS